MCEDCRGSYGPRRYELDLIVLRRIQHGPALHSASISVLTARASTEISAFMSLLFGALVALLAMPICHHAFQPEND